MVVALRVAIEQAANECDERDALEIRAPLASRRFLLILEQRLEAVCVAERFRGQRRDDLAKANVGVRERFGVAIGAEENRADDGRLPLDRHDDDRPHVARVERALDRPELRIARRIRNEHRLARIERAFQLRIAIEVDDEVANRRIFVARDEANFILLGGEEDRAAIEAECVAQLASDGLQNVDEVEGGRDLLENVDDRDEMIAFALQLGDARAQPSYFIVPPIGLLRRRQVGCCWSVVRRFWAVLIHLPPRGVR